MLRKVVTLQVLSLHEYTQLTKTVIVQGDTQYILIMWDNCKCALRIKIYKKASLIPYPPKGSDMRAVRPWLLPAQLWCQGVRELSLGQNHQELRQH